MEQPILLLTGKSKATLASNLNPVAAESYRTLRINIEFMSIELDRKTIVVTSTLRGEGRTATSLNLAIAYAQAGKKVLLIDGDLRKPGVHLWFEGEITHGLTHYLAQQCTISETIQNTNVPNLYVITSGSVPPNPSELLTSPRMSSLLNEAKQDYDMILIDAPPIVGFVEAKMLAAKCSGVVFVIEHGKVKKPIARIAKEELTSVSANLLGIVINKMNKKAAAAYR